MPIGYARVSTAGAWNSRFASKKTAKSKSDARAQTLFGSHQILRTPYRSNNFSLLMIGMFSV
jgi:hypothetical protein